MSSALEVAGAATPTFPIPALKTNSARAILDTFGDAVIELKASGSVVTPNGKEFDELYEYGVSWEQNVKEEVEVGYSQITGPDGEPDNPWDDAAIESFYEHVNAILNTESQSVKPDLAVQSVTIRVTDEALQDITPARTQEFDLSFVASPAEKPGRRVTRRANAERGLYTELGFNVCDLNLHSVTETAAELAQQYDGEYLSWDGPQNGLRPPIKPQLSVRINDRILPDQYGTLKHYKVVDDEALELVSEGSEKDSNGDDETAGSEAEN